MTEREEMLARAYLIGRGYDSHKIDSLKQSHSPEWIASLEITSALRSAASTGPDVAGFEACRELLRDVIDNGLIYWEPQTSRGATQKALMIARCEAASTGPDVAGFEAGRDAARMAALAQRCERGTTWDLACTTIAAAIAALPAPAGESVTGWRPIETAPKDMTELIVLCGRKDVRLGWYFAPSPTTFGWRDQHGAPIRPTHWTPLPTITRKSGARS